MRKSRNFCRKAGGGVGLQAPQYPARERIWTGKEPLLPRLAKHSDPIAKHIIKVSSYSRKWMSAFPYKYERTVPSAETTPDK